MSDETVWEDPPVTAAAGAKYRWLYLLEPLVEHPKRWARLAEVAAPNQVAGNLRKGRTVTPEGRWEFTSRSIKEKPGRGFVYARYLGPEDGAE